MSRRVSTTSSKRKTSRQSAQSDTMSDKKSKKASPKVAQKREGGKTKSKNLVDIFNEHAIVNAYYTCHNVQDLLKIRGFPWPELSKKKKKNKK